MRLCGDPGFRSLQAQRKTLPNAEAMLFIDDGKPELAEFDVFLKQRMCANRELCIAGRDTFKGQFVSA
jgi:hypothetical protein